MGQKQKILVIGAGIVGICVGRELLASGHDVTVIDKGEVGHGCSYANAGWVTPCFAMPLPQPGMFLKSIGWLLDSRSPLYIKPSLDPVLARWLLRFTLAMNRRKMLESISALTAISKFSFTYYKDFAAGAGSEVGFHTRGLLMVSGTQAGLDYARQEMNLMGEHGIRGQFMDADEVLKFEPMLKPVVKGGVFFPDEAQIEPLTVTKLLAQDFTKNGGKLQLNTEVFDFKLSGSGRIDEVVTTNGSFKPDTVVLAAGSWSPSVVKRLRLSIPMLGGKGYSMSVTAGGRKPLRPIMIVDRKIAVTPRADSIRLAGTLELVNQDFSISPTRVGAIYTGAQEFLDLADVSEPKNIWRGLRPCTPDGVPVIGYSKKLNNLFYCTGHQMLGLQSAPGSARLAAELISGQATYTDPLPFSPARFE